MLHAKFQNHRPSGFGEENFKRFLLFIAKAAMTEMGVGETGPNPGRDVPVSPTPISPTPVSPMICPISPTPVSPTPISPTPEMFTIPVSPTHLIWMNNMIKCCFIASYSFKYANIFQSLPKKSEISIFTYFLFLKNIII